MLQLLLSCQLAHPVHINISCQQAIQSSKENNWWRGLSITRNRNLAALDFAKEAANKWPYRMTSDLQLNEAKVWLSLLQKRLLGNSRWSTTVEHNDIEFVKHFQYLGSHVLMDYCEDKKLCRCTNVFTKSGYPAILAKVQRCTSTHRLLISNAIYAGKTWMMTENAHCIWYEMFVRHPGRHTDTNSWHM